MNNRLMIQRLWWKELRQLLPMLILLPTIAALLTTFNLITSNTNQFNWSAGVVVFLGMPGLFAVGAGALLVGQEKEMRTIQWLSSLPIRPQTIVRIKTAAAVVGLAILWIISGMYFLWRDRFEAPLTDFIQLPVWPVNSLFILFAGLALAWKNKSALVALLLVVPIAIVPYVLALVVHPILAGDKNHSTNPSPATVISMQLIGSVIALYLVERFGRRALSPERLRLASPFSAFQTQGEHSDRATSASDGVTQSPLPALIWQFAMQSRALLIGTSAMLLAASAILVFENRNSSGGIVQFAMLLCYLATSWLGASVFQSDSVDQRIRFLADRGIAPRLVWLTRQAVPITVITAIAIATFLLAILMGHARPQASPGFGIMALLTIAALFVVFSFSQWVGQVITSPIVSMVTAPLISIIPFAAYSFSVTTFSTPLTLIPIAALLPFLATFLSTRRWMDRRFGKRFWFTQAGYAVSILLLPALPHIVALVLEPGMSRQVRSQIDSVVADSSAYLRTPSELVLNQDAENETQFESFVQSWNEQINSVQSQLRATTSIGVSSERTVRKIFAINLLVGMSIQPNESSVSAEHLDLFQRSLVVLSDIVDRMRNSPLVIDQDFADSIEIAMVRQMRRAGVRVALGEERYNLIAERLANTNARRKARIRSVALSWYTYDSQSRTSRLPPGQFGGYDLLQGGVDGLSWRSGKRLANRRVARRAEHLWRLADFSGDEVPQEWLLAIASDWGKRPVEYGLGPTGNHYRINDVNRFVGTIQNDSKSVANQWYAGWENQARELVRLSN